jgi:hypothetical protein
VKIYNSIVGEDDILLEDDNLFCGPWEKNVPLGLEKSGEVIHQEYWLEAEFFHEFWEFWETEVLGAM